jgi:hypothetical protein
MDNKLFFLQLLKNHKKDFERLLGEASTLCFIIWQLYIEGKLMYYRSLDWPPPKLRDLVDDFVEYVYSLFFSSFHLCEWCV